MLVTICVCLATILQGVAAVSSFLLIRRHGWQWSWFLISIGFLLMTVRRSLTCYRLLVAETPVAEQMASESEALSGLISSVFLLVGVLMYGPLHRTMTEARVLAHQDRDRLANSLATAESGLVAARVIQQRLFPENDYKSDSLTISGRCQPMHFVAGDYYDYIPLANGDLAVVIADVAGHGVGPAILMAELRACLRTAARQSGDPAFLMTEANAILNDLATSGWFATSFLAVIQTRQKMISFVAAGHEGWLIRADGTPENLKPRNMPLGIVTEEVFEVQQVKYESHDVLLLTTDGVAEATNGDGRMYGKEAMLQTVSGLRMMPPCQLVDGLFSEVASFRGAAGLQDDITAVAVQFTV